LGLLVAATVLVIAPPLVGPGVGISWPLGRAAIHANSAVRGEGALPDIILAAKQAADDGGRRELRRHLVLQPPALPRGRCCHGAVTSSGAPRCSNNPVSADDDHPAAVEAVAAASHRARGRNQEKGGAEESDGRADLHRVRVYAPVWVMAPHPLYPLLDADYDAKHRAHLIIDNLQVLSVLRPRTHSAMRWHERYSDYIRRAGFLPLARIVNAGLPTMDGPALTALVDRWRPEIHTFHLPCGELTVTLQDVAMILGLPIDGHAVTGFAQPHGWRDTVEHLLGIRPPEPAVNEKDKKPSGVSSAWLTSHFNNLDDNADEGTVERFARAWLWHLVGGYLFPDASGNTISWLFLPILGQQWENIATYSWGSATLAWLYRSLCEACTRTGASPTLGGCAYLLQVWMWERFPVGRPDRGPAEVKWTPYSRPEIENMNLSPICKRDENYWRATIPLVWFFVVEWHLPQRVVRQFGLLQQPDVHQETTNRELHKIDRRKVRGPVDWVVKHQPYISLWDARERFSMYPYDGPAHRNGPYKEYLVWFHNNARVFIRPPVNIAELQESESDDDNDHMDGYDQATRESTQTERAPLHNYTASQLVRFGNDAGHALCHPQGSEEEVGALRAFAQDIIGSSQLGDAPAATQQSVRRAGRRRARDTSEVGSANIL
ncbi:hypothetical protein EJB05_00971, partial [Eragrostis curvula]